jgi:hypothetical protein
MEREKTLKKNHHLLTEKEKTLKKKKISSTHGEGENPSKKIICSTHGEGENPSKKKKKTS